MAAPNLPLGAPITKPEANLPPPSARLVPIDFGDQAQINALTKQRVACGWNSHHVPHWMEVQAKGDRQMFWVTVPEDTPQLPSHDATKNDEQGILKLDHDNVPVFCVGHVALDKEDTKSNDVFEPSSELASRETHLLSIATLFVHPAYKSMRLGAFAMDQCEHMAQRLPYGDPKCRAVTLNALSPRYLPGGGGKEGPDGLGMWERIGAPVPKVSNVLWYQRRGYVGFKEVQRYVEKALDGTEIRLYCLYMRKELGEVQGDS